MPSWRLVEYQAYERVAGLLGPARGDVQAAIVAATVANANRGKGKPATPADFIPNWDRKPEQTVDEMLQVVRALNTQLGGTVDTAEDDGTT